MVKVKVVLHGPGRGQVYVNGVKVPALIAFSLSAAVGRPNKLTLELLAQEVEFEGVTEVTVLDSSEREFAVHRVTGRVGAPEFEQEE